MSKQQVEVITNTNNKLSIDLQPLIEFIKEDYAWRGSRIVTARHVAQTFGLRYSSAQKVVKGILDGDLQ